MSVRFFCLSFFLGMFFALILGGFLTNSIVLRILRYLLFTFYMAEIDIWMFIGWLSLFLFGLRFFESWLKSFSQKTIKKFLSAFTKKLHGAIFTGMGVAALLQSQAATIILAMSFLGAWLISLPSVIGIIVGANIWSTLTPWLVSILGFSFSITKLALPLIAVGWLLYVFLGRITWIRHVSTLIFWFWLAFYGLGFMKESVLEFAMVFDLQAFVGLPLLVFYCIGLFFAIMMQSSTAVNVINLTALYAWIVSFPMAAMISLGAELGTTSSALFASFSWNRKIKFQAAFTQIFFNVLTGIICGLILFHPLMWFVQDVLWLRSQPTLALAAMITMYDLLTAFMFIPFVRWYTPFLEKLFPTKWEKVVLRVSYISPQDDYKIVSKALKSDIVLFVKQSMRFVLRVAHMNPPNVFNTLIDIEEIREKSVSLSEEEIYEHYQHLKWLEEELLKFLWRIKTRYLDSKQKESIERYSRAITNVMYACKYAKDVATNINEMAWSKHPFVQEQYAYIQKEFIWLYRKFAESLGDVDRAHLANSLVQRINRLFTYQHYLKGLLWDNSDIDDGVITTLINTFHHLHSSSKDMYLAFSYLYFYSLSDIESLQSV